MTVIHQIDKGSIVDVIVNHKQNETCPCKPIVTQTAKKVGGRYFYTKVINHTTMSVA